MWILYFLLGLLIMTGVGLVAWLVWAVAIACNALGANDDEHE